MSILFERIFVVGKFMELYMLYWYMYISISEGAMFHVQMLCSAIYYDHLVPKFTRLQVCALS